MTTDKVCLSGDQKNGPKKTKHSPKNQFFKNVKGEVQLRWAKIKFPGLSGPYLTWKKLFGQQYISLGVDSESEPLCGQTLRDIAQSGFYK